MKKNVYEFTLGDVILAYRKGFHVVVGLDPSDCSTGCIQYQTIAKADGTPVNSKTVHVCDALYCTKVTHESIESMLDAEQNSLDKKRQRLSELFTNFHIEER